MFLAHYIIILKCCVPLIPSNLTTNSSVQVAPICISFGLPDGVEKETKTHCGGTNKASFMGRWSHSIWPHPHVGDRYPNFSPGKVCPKGTPRSYYDANKVCPHAHTCLTASIAYNLQPTCHHLKYLSYSRSLLEFLMSSTSSTYFSHISASTFVFYCFCLSFSCHPYILFLGKGLFK